MGMEQIEHIVVAMMENRSFDNLLGWLYESQNNRPPINIPRLFPTTFAGLSRDTYSNKLNGLDVFATRPPSKWPPKNNPSVVPTPDPNEEFDHITSQVFGTATPTPGAQADMSGFLTDYATTNAGTATAGQIMETNGPEAAPVINGLARSFAVCDEWFASVPTQTWPNRGFVHTGSSDGHINNDEYEQYDIPTIFNVLQNHQKSWAVFHNSTFVPSLTLGQFFFKLISLDASFHGFNRFKALCNANANASPAEKLPSYSFIEPRFMPELGLLKIDYPSDYHPPHNICRGEQFLADVYESVRNSPYRDKILLVITFDEHGGCFDHVPPPIGAVSPEPWPTSRDGRFDFKRYGVRVPAIVISSYVEAGTVFRAGPGEPPFDHTSILATLRDWLSLDSDPGNPFLQSPRIGTAPALDRVLTLNEQTKRTDWPEITAEYAINFDDESLQTPLNDVQKSLIAAAIRLKAFQQAKSATFAIASSQLAAVSANAAQQAKALHTYADALRFLHPDAPP